MRLERISQNKIKYSITFDELADKGFLQEEMVKESFIWDELFDEMLEEASKEYSLQTDGAVSIEIFSLTSKELVLILTLDEADSHGPCSGEGKDRQDRSILNECIFEFDDFDHLVLLAHRLKNMEQVPSSLFHYRDRYFLILDIRGMKLEGVMSLCLEYGTISPVTQYVLKEYGKTILDANALETLRSSFC
ncbi:MAG TPA: adaptor protein MecA [Bacillaceae bacterium]